MNCRFCGNFVPEGKDSCPVCGRRPEEEPIGKLLSENQPGAVQTVEPTSSAKEESGKKHPKGLLLPLAMIAIGVLGWMYALLGDSAENFKSMLAAVTGTGTTQAPDSDFVVSGAANAIEMEGIALYLIIAAVVTIVGVGGIIWLFKRLYNRIKY